MGKHEAKVSRRKYFINITIAVLISLIGGILTGYFLAQYFSLKGAPQNNAVQPPAQQEVKNEEPQKLAKEEQISEVKSALKSYFDINTATVNKLISDSLKESTSSGQPQEAIFKDKLSKLYQGILVNDVLEAIKTFIDEGSLKSSYFVEYYKEQEGSQVKSVEITDYHNNTISAEVTITDTFEYSDIGTDTLPTSAVFFSTLKGKGVNSGRYAKLVSLKPSKVNVLKTSTGTVIIENIKDKWYISSYDVSLASTEITDVTIKGVKMTLNEFINKYPIK